MEPWTATSSFFLFAAILQAAIGFTIVVRRPRVESAWVIAVLFLLNAAESVCSLILAQVGDDPDLKGWARRVRFYFDRSSTFLIAYLALAYPFRPRWLADRPWVLPVVVLGPLLALLATAAVAGHELLGTQGVFYDSKETPLGYANQIVLASIPFAILLLRWPRLLLREQSPVLRRQFQFVFAAFGIRAVHISIQAALNFFAFNTIEGPLRVAEAFIRIAQVAAAVYAITFLVTQRTKAPSDTRRSADFVLAFMFVGVALAFLASLGQDVLRNFYTNPINAIDLVIVRPALLYFAIARYDLLGARFRSTALGIALVVLMAFPLLYVGVLPAYGVLPLTAIGPLGKQVVAHACAALTSLLLTLVLVRVLQPYLRPADVREGVAGRVEDYVAALEDLHRNKSANDEAIAGLEPLRRALGVTDEQARALRDAVRSRWTSGRGPWNPGDRVLGRYEVVRLLGDGGNATTHLAKDLLAEEDVVLKRVRMVDEAARRAILHEAYQLGKLSHPNVVRMLRTESIDGEPVLVLEHLKGGSLATRLGRDGHLPPDALARIARDTLRGLAAAHELGIVHRDVKPANILFDGAGRAKLCDFGIARHARPRRDLGDPTPSSAGATGTLRYMAPEQVRGLAADARSDLYALGVVLLEAATGEHPVRAELGDYEQRRMIVEGPVPAIPRTLPEPWRRLLRRLLDKEPSRRPPSAAAALGDPALVSPRGTAAGSARPG